jgi:hexosaminidase
MKTRLILLLYIVFSSKIWTQNHYSIIPKPNSVIYLKRPITTFEKTINLYNETNNFMNEEEWLKNILFSHFNLEIVKTKKSKKGKGIYFHKLDSLNENAYRIIINDKKIKLYASSNKGMFYAMQTLLQMFNSVEDIRFPSVVINDEPSFEWRGMHLDVCRHFFTVEEVKKYIDYLAMYKMNVFHWHLTEDQGWRIEIKRYPKLTEVGAWRNGSMVGHYREQTFDTVRYGGFYTQEDIKEVVAYATERHITVVPEIEMPGHALAALSAYPEYSCSGGPFEVAKMWGVFDDVYCAGNDSTFTFIQNIFDEVLNLFPSEYIHIGGDECPKTRWKACDKCQKRIADENLKDEHELQSYFIQRIEKYLNSKGRKIIGWDEILEGGLAPNAAVMSWRGTDGGVAAAKQQHYVVMSPGKPCYFDHYQNPNTKEEPIAIGGLNTLKDVFLYQPVPSSLNATEQTYIMGAQANVWTEYMNSFSHVEYMALPRMAAISEVLWSNKNNRNYEEFIQRLNTNVKLLDKLGVNYCKLFLTQP